MKIKVPLQEKGVDVCLLEQLDWFSSLQQLSEKIRRVSACG